MANFTDEIMQFNPYISTVPVEDYLRVGMQKQAQYDMGVQKVQSYIDNVAGLEISKGVHKQYLNSQLSRLQEGVKKVASADFSNAQLVNQIGGAAKNIANDPVLRNAVASTAFHKKQYELLEKERAEGKLNPANEWDYMNEYQKWMNDGDVNSSFNYNYTPYRDVTKKLLEAFKSLKEDGSITDLPFKLDDKGQILMVDGSPVVNPVMLREQYKGVSAKRISDTMKAVLDEGDIRQLNISGKYQYRGATPEDLVKISTANARNMVSNLRETILSLRAKQAAEPENGKKIQETIEDLEEKLASASESLKNTEPALLAAAQNTEAFAGKMFTNDFFNNVISAFAHGETQRTYHENPYQKYIFDAEQLQLQKDKFQWEQQKYLLDIEKEKETKKKDSEKELDEGFTAQGNLDTKGLDDALKEKETEIKTLETSLSQLDQQAINSEPAFKALSAPKQKQALDIAYEKFLNEGYESKNPFINKYLNERRELEMKLAKSNNVYQEGKRVKEGMINEMNNNLGKFAPEGKIAEMLFPLTNTLFNWMYPSTGKIRDEANKYLRERQIQMLPKTLAVGETTDSNKEWVAIANALLDSGNAAMSKGDASSLREALKKEKVLFSLNKQGDNFKLIVDGKYQLDISKEELLTKFPDAKLTSPYDGIIEDIMSSPSKTSTNVKDKNDPTGARYLGNAMPKLKTYKSKTRADIESDGRGGYSLKLYIYDDQAKTRDKWIKFYVGSETKELPDILGQMKEIDDNYIETKLNEYR